MKTFISIRSPESTNPVQLAIGVIVEANPNLEVVGMAEEAGLIITNEARQALDFLKDDENVKVLVATFPGRQGESDRRGAESLTKAYPGRVLTRPMMAFNGEEELVPFLLTFTGAMQ